jgi:hypothetical protein
VNRKTYINIFAAGLICLTFGLLTGCSNSSSSTPPPNNNQTPTVAITVSTGSGQSAPVGTAFANPLVANVTSNGTAASGVVVTFSAPASGASCALSSTSATTDSNGNAQVTCTANSTAGAYSVTATASGATSPASFGLTNTTTVASSNIYVFYASGEDGFGGVQNYSAVAGAVTIDPSNGNVTGGELDYNDAAGLTSGGGTGVPDTVTGGTLTVDATTGVGTLSLTTSNLSLGGVNTAAGTVEFAIQFVNSNHALIAQFDGSATSSGSFDLQNTALGTGGQSSFALSGVDNSYNSVAFGGIFSPTSATQANVTLDVNDNGTVSPNNPYTATLGPADSFGRTLITGISNPASASPYAITFAAYPVTQEAIRLIDVDTTDTAVGSAYGQGSAAGKFSNASFGTTTPYVFTLLGQWNEQYGSLGQFSTNGSGTITGGVADDNELDNSVEEVGDTLSGSYNITGTGYSTLSPTWGSGLENVNLLGVYMVDTGLDINDPNNTTSLDVGGAVVVDLSSTGLVGGIGVITPATDPSAATFNGSYAAGFQNFNAFNNGCTEPCIQFELDMVGPFTMVSGGLLSTVNTSSTTGAYDSDPFGTWTGTPAESMDDTFTSTPASIATGVYDMSSLNSPNNQLEATINGSGPGGLDVDIYQASGTQLYWLNFDTNSLFLGPFEAQNLSGGVPAARKSSGKSQTKQNGDTKPTSAGGAFDGTFHWGSRR